jgi:sialate O-acetylesterase
MINPLRKFNIKGVIWCQGENNINDPRNYGDRMKSLISGWRSSFSQKKLPFLYVQIAPFNYLGRTRQYFTGTENSLGYLVEQQTKALTLKHVYMARTGDIGDVGFIHYRNKQEAGKRLFLLALKKVYTNNDDELVNGPQVSNVSFTNNRAIVVYKQIGAGLSIKGSTVNGFELSDDGVKFYPATAKMDGNKVIVQGVNLPKVVALRYCFKNVQEVNLFNAAGLPALPFRTDSTPYVKPVY